MRILLGILALLAVFAAVSLYHGRFTAQAREDRATAQGASTLDRPLPDGYPGRVIIGEKSGAPIVEDLRPVPTPSTPAPRVVVPKPATRAPTRPGAEVPTTHVVGRGESLSAICAKRYGTSKPEIVNAVARYNGLKSANALREGVELKLPPPSALGLGGR